MLPEPEHFKLHPRHHQQYRDSQTHETSLGLLASWILIAVKVCSRIIRNKDLGPDTGEPNIGREDDDDDNCVGFHRFSGPARRIDSLLRSG